MEIYGSVTHFV